MEIIIKRMQFGSIFADVYWSLTENPDKASKELKNFEEIVKIEERANIEKSEKDILQDGLNKVHEKISEALKHTKKRKVIIFVTKSLSSARLEGKEKGWLHNKLNLLFGVWGDTNENY